MTSHPFWSNFFRNDSDMMQRIVEMWLQTPLFEGIRESRARHLIGNLHVRHYQEGETIFMQGELGAGAVLVVDGCVRIESAGQELARLDSGDFFGEVALVVNEPRTATAIACNAADLVFLLKKDVEEWINRSPRDGARLMSNVAGILAHRLERANRQNRLTPGTE